MKCKVIKPFNRRGELQLPGSTIEVPESMLQKLTGYVQAVATADSYAPKDWRPEPKAWLTDFGELRTQGVFDDLAEEIIRLTTDNLPLQAKLLRERCGDYSGLYWENKVEEWEERAAIMQYDGGMKREQAEEEAARLYGMEAFLDELHRHE